MNENVERIKPLKLTVKGETYELDFSRESVSFAQNNNFMLEDLSKFVTLKVPEFFYYAFRMHHRRLARNQTDSILNEIHGLTPKMLERLIFLYNQAEMSNNVIQDDEELAKNANVVVEMD